MADSMQRLTLFMTSKPWMSQARCLSQFFSCTMIPPFLPLQKLTSAFLPACISSCVTSSPGACRWPPVCIGVNFKEVKGTFHNMVLITLSSPREGWSHAEKAVYGVRRYSTNPAAVHYLQSCNARCEQLVVSLQFLIPQEGNYFLHFCGLCTRTVWNSIHVCETSPAHLGQSALMGSFMNSVATPFPRAVYTDCSSVSWIPLLWWNLISSIRNWTSNYTTGILNIPCWVYVTEKSSRREEELQWVLLFGHVVTQFFSTAFSSPFWQPPLGAATDLGQRDLTCGPAMPRVNSFQPSRGAPSWHRTGQGLGLKERS